MSHLLDPTLIFRLLVAGAFLLPVAAVILWRTGLVRHQRVLLCLAAAGPWMLALWGIHEVLIRSVGFDSLYTAGALAGAAILSGWFAGWWAGRSSRRFGESLAGERKPEDPGI